MVTKHVHNHCVRLALRVAMCHSQQHLPPNGLPMRELVFAIAPATLKKCLQPSLSSTRPQNLSPNGSHLCGPSHRFRNQPFLVLRKHSYHSHYPKTYHPMEVNLCGPNHRFRNQPFLVLCNHSYHSHYPQTSQNPQTYHAMETLCVSWSSQHCTC